MADKTGPSGKENTILTTQKQKIVIGVICGNFKFRLQYRKYNSRPSIIKALLFIKTLPPSISKDRHGNGCASLEFAQKRSRTPVEYIQIGLYEASQASVWRFKKVKARLY